MVKLKLERVRQWFTPIQAARFLFEDAGLVNSEELILELENLVKNFKLHGCIRNYEIEPIIESIEESNDGYLRLIQFYNHMQVVLPVEMGFSLNDDWMTSSGVITEVVGRVSITDVYDFWQKYSEDPELDDDSYIFWSANYESQIHIHVRLNRCEFGFTQDELNQFIEKQLNKDKEKNIDKPLSNKERETLLVIIAALAKEAKIPIDRISKAGDLIASLTQTLGAPVGATTIENHLKQIQNALEKRMK